ncbi:MAG: ABC transporter ATP-binding protein [Methyloligellaceae bacterium]
MSKLELDDVSISLGKTRAVEHLSLTVEPGEFVVLLGPNGAGKTTLVRAVAGLVSYTGSIKLGGEDISHIEEYRRGKKISYMPQGHDVHWPMRVRDIVGLGRLPYRPVFANESPKDKSFIDKALEITDLQAFAERRFDQLSGGEKSRVMVARALATEAPLLLADEPTAALDPYNQLHMLELLRSHADQGNSIVAVLHDILLAAQFADKLVLLKDGKCVEAGSAEKVLSEANIREVYRIEASQRLALGRGLWQRIS